MLSPLFNGVSILDSAYAAAAANSLQSCPTPCDPIDGSPPGSSIPGILQARIPEWAAVGAIFLVTLGDFLFSKKLNSILNVD